MTILFRIALPADETEPPAAVITARQLTALRRYLHAEGDRMGTALLEPDEVLGDTFEARVCPLALASLTKLFDHDPSVISVIEEAQFRGRRISIHHCLRIPGSSRPAFRFDPGRDSEMMPATIPSNSRPPGKE